MGHKLFFYKISYASENKINSNDCCSPSTLDWYESICFSTVNKNLARLTKIGKIKNNPSNNRHYYYLIDNSTDITDSQPPILTITNTPIVEKNVNIDNSLNSIPDQIDSFISSGTEPDATEFSDTLNLFDNAYKNIKYQKIKDILLKDI